MTAQHKDKSLPPWIVIADGEEHPAYGGYITTSAADNVKEARPDGEMVALSAENASKSGRVNEQLAIIRQKLFGDCSAPEKDDGGPNRPPAPVPSIHGSLGITNDELLESFRHLDSILARL